MRKDTIINISLIDDIDTIYSMVMSIMNDHSVQKKSESSVHYILDPRYVFRLAIQRLRLENQTHVTVGMIYNAIGRIYDVLPYIITSYEDEYIYESDTRYQFDIKGLPIFIFKFFEELNVDKELETKVAYQIYRYSKDIIKEEFDADKGLHYYLSKLSNTLDQ